MALPEAESYFLDDSTWKTLYTRDGKASQKFLDRLDAANLDEIVNKYPTLIEKLKENETSLAQIVAFFVRDELADGTIDSEFEVFIFAWSCFVLFLKLNWFETQIVDEEETWWKKEWSLSIDGEDLKKLVLAPFLLAVVEELFGQLVEQGRYFFSHSLWHFRSLIIHQGTLFHPTQTLKTKIDTCVENLQKFDFGADPSGYLKASLHIELGWFYYNHFHFESCKKSFESAAEATGLVVERTAVMGRRTKYQKKATAQMVIIATSRDQDKHNTEPNVEIFPENVILDDETLLAETSFEGDVAFLKLIPLDQCILIGLSCAQSKLNRVAQLSDDEQFAYLSRVSRHPQIWSIQMKALFLRSYCEIFGKTKFIRAIQQFEALILNYDNITEPSPYLSYLFQSGLESKWETYSMLGQAYYDMSMVNSALALFEKIDNFPKQCECLALAGRKQDARNLINARLEEEPTPLLYCLLGDIDDSYDHYETAWELSGHKYVRAIRCMASFKFQKKQFEESIPLFEESLALNRYFPLGWTRLSHCYMQQKNWEKACAALTSAVSCSPDDFKVWNDLAANHCHLENWPQAMYALEQAARLKWDSWRIWENLVTVSIKLQDINKLMRSASKLIDLQDNVQRKEEAWNIEQKLTEQAPPMSPMVFDIMATLLTEGDIDSYVAEYLHKTFQGIITKVCQKYSADVRFWNIFASYFTTIGKLEKAIEFRNKEYRELLRRKNELEADEAYLCIGECLKELFALHIQSPSKKVMYSCKSMLNAFKKKFTTSGDRSITTELEKLMQTLVSSTETNTNLSKPKDDKYSDWR